MKVVFLDFDGVLNSSRTTIAYGGVSWSGADGIRAKMDDVAIRLIGGIVRKAGDWRFRWTGRMAHRIELTHSICWTLFITGPRYRSWGFHCPKAGWVHWKLFTATDDQGLTGKGCDQ